MNYAEWSIKEVWDLKSNLLVCLSLKMHKQKRFGKTVLLIYFLISMPINQNPIIDPSNVNTGVMKTLMNSKP